MKARTLQIKPRKTIEKSVDNEALDPWKVLLVDDDADVISITMHILSDFEFEQRKVQLLCASSCSEGKLLIDAHQDAAVALIDVIMEKRDAGLQLVNYIREKYPNLNTQLVIRTGHPGNTPEREVLTNYNICDYLSKADLDSNRLQHRMIGYLRGFKQLEKIKIQNSKLECLLKEKEKITSIVSHELRGPLNNIKGLLQLIELDSEKAKEEYTDYLKTISANADRMIYQVRDLLDSTQVGQNNFNINKKLMFANDFINEIKPTLELQSNCIYQNKNIIFSISNENDLPEIFIDPERITQVIMNLITNAFKYTESGTISLQFKADEHYFYIYIVDTGKGIEKEKIETIFKSFSQLNAGGNIYDNGIGLGLSIVKTIIDLHFGHIDVESNLDIGSTFRVTIPLNQQQ